MKMYYWRSPHGNFGDDMNGFLWNHFMPELFDADDDIVFVGIGSILFDALPKARLRVVLGAGIGYGRFPSDLHDAGWRIFAVRGPLTAQAVGAPELATTDPAALLPLLPEFETRDRTGRVAFVPHWTAAGHGRWQEACRRAGIDFVDPRDEAKSVIRRISTAALVIAESMHAAIVADAFRVPWIPIVSGHDAPLKWHDWTLSLGMQYRPVRISNVNSARRTLSDIVRRRVVCRSPPGNDCKQHAQTELSAFLARSRNGKRGALRTSKSALRAKVSDLVDGATRSLIVQRAAETLQTLRELPPVLSRDTNLSGRQAMLLESIATLRRAYSAGKLER